MSRAPEERPFPLALPAPNAAVVALDETLLAAAVEASRRSPRRRVILPLHKGPGENLHRMFNAIQPGSYIRPHRHLAPPKAESFVVLRGAARFVVFDDRGRIERSYALQAGGPAFGMDVAAGVFHTFFALEPDTVFFEVKPGPYEPASDKDFAPWAPPEGSPEAAAYLTRLART